MSFGRLGEEEEKGLVGEVGEGFETALDLKDRSLTVPPRMIFFGGGGLKSADVICTCPQKCYVSAGQTESAVGRLGLR